MLTVIVEKLGGNVTLRCRGRIVRGEESTILCAAIQQRVREVTLDLSGVSAIDAAGIGALVSLQAAGIYLKLVNATATVRELLRLTKVDSVFDISGSDSTDATIEDLAIDRSGASLHSELQTAPCSRWLRIARIGRAKWKELSGLINGIWTRLQPSC